MSYSKKGIIFIIIILILNICVSAFLYHKYKTHECSKEAVLNDSIEHLNKVYFAFEDIFTFSYLNSDLNISIKNNKFSLYNLNGDSLNLHDIAFSYELFIFIPKYECRKCFVNLCEILKSNGIVDRTMFIFQSNQDAMYLLELNQNILTNIFLIKGEIGVPAERDRQMFIFSLTNGSYISDIYIPQIELNNITEAYVRIVANKKQGKFSLINDF